MNKFAVYHAMDSAYCFPVSKKEIVLRLRTAKQDILKAWVIYENKYVFWQTQQKVEMEKTFSGELFDYFSIKLSLEDTRLAYVFYLFDGESYYFFSEDGITQTYQYQLGYYHFFQYPYINEADIMPKIHWMDHAVFYQIFVDRFCRGNWDKDERYITCKWGDIPNPKTFAGGDLQGVIDKLDYLEQLGITVIYLTPIFESISNHKYDISDYYQVDRQFGTNEDLKKLVQEAKKKNIRIILDAVFNHCSDRTKQFQDVIEKGKASPYYDWFVIHGEKPEAATLNYEVFASCDYMPKWNTSNEEVQQYLIQIACHYIREYNIAGWRLDVSDEISHDFWRRFRKAVKAEDENAVIIGENWHDASNYLRGDQYDSIMNYAFTKSILDFYKFQTKDAKQFAEKLNDILVRNTDTVNAMMLNLLDSHDTDRIYSELDCKKERLLEALCILFLFPGVPCIFYGTEILTQGGFDPDCRRCMDWEKAEVEKESEVMRVIKRLTKLRAEYNLSDAAVKIYAKDSLFILERLDEGMQIKLIINHSEQECQYEDELIEKNSYQVYLNHQCIISNGKERHV